MGTCQNKPRGWKFYTILFTNSCGKNKNILAARRLEGETRPSSWAEEWGEYRGLFKTARTYTHTIHTRIYYKRREVGLCIVVFVVGVRTTAATKSPVRSVVCSVDNQRRTLKSRTWLLARFFFFLPFVFDSPFRLSLWCCCCWCTSSGPLWRSTYFSGSHIIYIYI